MAGLAQARPGFICVTQPTRMTPGRQDRMLESETLDTLLRTGLMRSPLNVVVFDAELRVIWAQKAGERPGSGIRASDYAGRRLGEVLPGMDVDLIEQSV